MYFGSKFIYLGNDQEDEEEVKVSEQDDIVLSDSDVSDDDGETCLLDILDTAGQEEYSSMKDQYVRSGDGFVIIYSVTDRESFSEAEAVYRWLKRIRDEDSHAILVANKQDLKDEAVISAETGKELAGKLGIPFYETSAKAGTGIDDALKGLIRLIPRRGNDYKIVMLGSGAVGKSSITLRFVSNTFLEDYDPTIEDSYRKMITVNGLSAVSKDNKKAAKKAKKLKKRATTDNRSDLDLFGQRQNVGGIACQSLSVRSKRPQSAASKKKGGIIQGMYRSLRSAVGRPSSANVADQFQPQPIPQQQITQMPQQQQQIPPPPPPRSSVSDGYVPPPPGPPPVVKKERKADGNVVLISLGTLEGEPSLVTGDALKCKQCEAVLTSTAVLQSDGDKKIWICEFCGCENRDLDLADDEVPKGDCLDYMLSPATEPAAEADQEMAEASDDVKKPTQKEGVIVYCMDISSSMQAACQVPESQTSWRQERLGTSETNRVSRLNCIQMAVERLAEQLKIDEPQKKILLVVFSSQVLVKAGGSVENMSTYNNVENDTFEGLVKKGEELRQRCPLNPLEESYEQLVTAVQNLRTTGCTALGPALSICTGFVNEIPGSEIVLCTDGEPNVGVGSRNSNASNTHFYEMVGRYARSKNTTINILAVEGASCDLQAVSAAAEHSGGTTNKLNPAELVRQLRSIAQNEVVATAVTVRFFLHPDFVFDEPEFGDNLSQLEKEVGSARKETDLTFRFKLKDPSKTSDIDSIPFQVQITYTKPNGMKCLRILSKKNEATTTRKDMEENINATVMSVSTMKTTALMAKKGKSREAQHMLKNVKRMVARGAKTEEQREARLAFNNEIETWDDELTYNNDIYCMPSGGAQSDGASHMIQMNLQMNKTRSDVGASKMSRVMNQKKMNTKSKAAYYSYRNDLM